MSRFYVGQRVRVDCPVSPVHGKETTVLATDVWGLDFGREFYGVEVNIRHGRGFAYFVFENHELIPITPPHQSCDTEFKASLDELLARQEHPA